jgi:hypothetical protein
MDTQAASAQGPQTSTPIAQNNAAPPPPSSEGKQNSQPNGKMPTPEAPQNKAPELYEVTVNGKVEKMSLQELKNHASMAHAAHQRFEEAAKMRKQYEEFDAISQKDMIQALKAKGFSNRQIQDQFEKWYMAEVIEPEKLTPDQRKLKEYELKLKKYQDEEQEKLAKVQQEEADRLTAMQKEYLQGQIIEALEKSGLPKTKLIASRMAFYMRENLVKGWNAPVEVIVQQVRQERQALMNGEVGSLEGEALIQYLGEDVVNKIRKWDLTQLRARKQNAGGELSQPALLPNGHAQKISSSEVTRRLREIQAGKR